MNLPRRRFLSSLALAATVPVRATARPRARAMEGLIPPLLTDDQIVRYAAGVRPFRRGGPRIQRQQSGGKTIVHNYGHGGAGFTLSWGSAQAAADLVRDVARGTPIAVLGSGVVGLCTASVLQERGLRVRVYAREFPPHTTSDVAGAEWSPDFVERGATPEAKQSFDRLLVRSWHRFQSLVGDRWGVRRRPIYEADDVASGLDDLPRGLVQKSRSVAALPFAPARRGRVYETWLIEAPIFLATLVEEVKRAGAVFEQRTFANLVELGGLSEPVIVNCLGLGAGALLADQAVVPVRGQLVHLKPQPLSYLLDHPNGYVIPRSDALVLGGTFEEGVSHVRTDPAACARILEDNRRFFAPG